MTSNPSVLTAIDLHPAHGVARLDEYVNSVWAFEPRRFMAMYEMVRKMDLSAHILGGSDRLHVNVEVLPMRRLDDEDDLMGLAEGDDEADSVDMEEISGNSVAVIHVTGTLMKQQSSLSSACSTVMLRKQIRDMAADSNVAGIVMLFDSPGGSVSGLTEVADEINAAAKVKPVLAFCEDLCASAAYWLACQCDEIFCNNGTCEIGSIGTFIGIYDYSGMCEKEGILAKVYATGPLKGTAFPGAKITEEQDKYLQGIVDQTQVYFANAVKTGREMSDAELQAVATGGVFLASDPAAGKLHDGIKNFDQCLQRMGELVALRRGGASQRGGLAMSEPNKGTAAPSPANSLKAESAAVDAKAELRRYLDAFGSQGAEWYAEGRSFEACQTQAMDDLRKANVTQAKDLADLKDRVKAIRGSDPAPSAVEPEGKTAPVSLNSLQLKLGKNLAARAMEIPIRSKGADEFEIIIGNAPIQRQAASTTVVVPGANGLTLLDITKMNSSDGVVGVVDETIRSTPEVMLGAARTIKGLNYKALIRKTLPTVGFRDANAGATQSKSVYEQALIDTFILNPRITSDKVVADASEDGPNAALALEESAVMEASLQLLGKCFYYGRRTTLGGDAKSFPGLLDFVDSTLIVDAGGNTASTASSVWFVAFGQQKLQWVFGNNGQLAFEPMRIGDVFDVNGNAFTAYIEEIAARPGLQFLNRYSAVRIKNVTADSGHTLTDALLGQALALLPAAFRTSITNIFMSPRSAEQLRGSRTAVNPTGAPAPTPQDFERIPISITDSISNVEAINQA